MRQVLEKVTNDLHYYVDGQKQSGKNPQMYGDCTPLSGDCTGLYGYCTGLYGNCTGLRGDCTGLYGDCTGLYGDCTGLSGYLDAAEFTDKDRIKGVILESLIRKQ